MPALQDLTPSVGEVFLCPALPTLATCVRNCGGHRAGQPFKVSTQAFSVDAIVTLVLSDPRPRAHPTPRRRWLTSAVEGDHPGAGPVVCHPAQKFYA
jgi:hypothetical protein